MKSAIIGCSGYIAGFIIAEMQHRFPEEELVKIGSRPRENVKIINLLTPEKFDYDLLNDVDFVVFTAAISGPDQCAKEFDTCWKINVEGSRKFINEALQRNCRILFFSSDAVYGGNPTEIYDETSDLSGTTSYGLMKKEIEKTFSDEPNFKSIRLSYVVSASDRFVSYCIKCMQSHEMADVFHPLYRNCVSVSDVVETVIWFKENWGKYPHKLLNLAGFELVSRIRIADEVRRYLGSCLEYTITKPSEVFYENRPAITQVKSLYRDKYKIYKNNTFTEKIIHELRYVKL